MEPNGYVMWKNKYLNYYYIPKIQRMAFIPQARSTIVFIISRTVSAGDELLSSKIPVVSTMVYCLPLMVPVSLLQDFVVDSYRIIVMVNNEINFMQNIET